MWYSPRPDNTKLWEEPFSMLHMIGHALFGLVVGIIARMVIPGRQPGGIVLTAIIGMAGGWLGGYIGKALGWYKEGQAAGFLMSVAGAIILYLVFRTVF